MPNRNNAPAIYHNYIGFKIENHLYDGLDDYCRVNNCSQSEAVRRGIMLLLSKASKTIDKKNSR